MTFYVESLDVLYIEPFFQMGLYEKDSLTPTLYKKTLCVAINLIRVFMK